jgi:heptosyltransferase-1
LIRGKTILVIRIGAMGDIIHALPAVASLKASFPESQLHWVVSERWLALLEGNPSVDGTVTFDRSSFSGLIQTRNRLRTVAPDLAIDFQGLIKSALAGRVARPAAFYGFDRDDVRERPASWLYTHRIAVRGPHRVERNLQLAAAAGAKKMQYEAWIPPGQVEGELPNSPFVLATPFAGWAGKEWPLSSLDELGSRLRGAGFDLVANVPASRADELSGFKNIRIHQSSLRGLIGAMRLAAAVVAPDSGPLHLAAALRKRGVALFGPTDPASNGPFGGTLIVLRADDAETTYKRHKEIHPSMRRITVDQVMSALMASLPRHESRAV